MASERIKIFVTGGTSAEAALAGTEFWPRIHPENFKSKIQSSSQLYVGVRGQTGPLDQIDDFSQADPDTTIPFPVEAA
jgi:hypothetical protein